MFWDLFLSVFLRHKASKSLFLQRNCRTKNISFRCVSWLFVILHFGMWLKKKRGGKKKQESEMGKFIVACVSSQKKKISKKNRSKAVIRWKKAKRVNIMGVFLTTLSLHGIEINSILFIFFNLQQRCDEWRAKKRKNKKLRTWQINNFETFFVFHWNTHLIDDDDDDERCEKQKFTQLSVDDKSPASEEQK